MKMQSALSMKLVAIATVVGMFAGCSAPTGYQKGEQAGTAMTTAATSITRTSDQVERTLAALDELVERPQPDLTQQFRAFTAELNTLESMARQVSTEAQAMKSKGAVYFDRWDQELATIQNENIRNRSEARRNEVSANFKAIGANYAKAEAEFKPFLADLRDVQTFLATDLTSGGIDAVKKFATKANADAVPLRKTLATLAEEFKAMGATLTPR